MFDRLFSQYPTEDRDHLLSLAEVWSIELGRIIERMLEIARADGSGALPLDARPEAIFELAKLIFHLEDRILETKTASTPISQVNPKAEREALASPLVKQRIENTARVYAECVWIKFQDKWWKKFPALELDTPKGKLIRIGNNQKTGVRRQHFSPASTNRRWAASNGKVRVYYRTLSGTVRHRDVLAKSWGREPFLYSQQMERLFSLIEGDAGPVYRKLLDLIPINETDRRHWVAFLAAQVFRTPAFSLLYLPRLKNVIEKRGLDYPTDVASLRRAYETLFTNNRVFAAMYRLIVGRQWVMWYASDGAEFIRSDDPILVEGAIRTRDWCLLYPMTPTTCFVAGPAKRMDRSDLVPQTRRLCSREIELANRSLAKAARRSVIARPRTDDYELRQLLTENLSTRWEALSAIGPILPEYWGVIE